VSCSPGSSPAATIDARDLCVRCCAMRVLRSREYPRLAWKNGLGVSRIIAATPNGAGYDTLRWQVSITEIASSCPFSRLPGLDRQFMLLEGRGVELDCLDEVAGTAIRHHVDTALEPVSFSGDWRTDCHLIAGPVQVMNVVTRRGMASSRVATHTISDRIVLERVPGESFVVIVASGMVTAGSSSAPLKARDALLVGPHADGEPAILPVEGAPVQLVVVAVRDPSR
jgi:environmental stress-induced protein Ves